jgi:hypothetical protein
MLTNWNLNQTLVTHSKSCLERLMASIVALCRESLLLLIKESVLVMSLAVLMIWLKNVSIAKVVRGL